MRCSGNNFWKNYKLLDYLLYSEEVCGYSCISFQHSLICSDVPSLNFPECCYFFRYLYSNSSHFSFLSPAATPHSPLFFPALLTTTTSISLLVIPSTTFHPTFISPRYDHHRCLRDRRRRPPVPFTPPPPYCPTVEESWGVMRGRGVLSPSC